MVYPFRTIRRADRHIETKVGAGGGSPKSETMGNLRGGKGEVTAVPSCRFDREGITKAYEEWEKVKGGIGDMGVFRTLPTELAKQENGVATYKREGGEEVATIVSRP